MYCLGVHERSTAQISVSILMSLGRYNILYPCSRRLWQASSETFRCVNVSVCHHGPLLVALLPRIMQIGIISRWTTRKQVEIAKLHPIWCGIWQRHGNVAWQWVVYDYCTHRQKKFLMSNACRIHFCQINRFNVGRIKDATLYFNRKFCNPTFFF